MVGKRHAHGRANVRRKWKTTGRAAFQVAIGNQVRLQCGLLAILDLLLPDFAGMVNSVLSFLVRVFQIEWTLESHAPILRRSHLETAHWGWAGRRDATIRKRGLLDPGLADAVFLEQVKRWSRRRAAQARGRECREGRVPSAFV